MNKYEILDRIGEGEYGLVLKGRNKESNELVAIKKFKEDDSDQQNKRVILRQVKILKMLSHENIIQLKQAFRKKGKIYLVCEYVQKNLLQIIDQGPVPTSQVKHYIFQLLKGIAYMHANNVIHRDVKPENVLISKQGSVKICDFGFARTVPKNKGMTDYVATRWYRAPQLLIGRQDYDKSIDVWSIGCVMAETVDGQPLFPGQNDLDQLYLIQKCLGPLIASHQQHFLKNPKFIGMKFPEIHNLESIQRRYFGKIDKQGLDLLKKMLKMDPKGRITAQQALNHPYFSRNSSVCEIQPKKGKESNEEKKYEDLTSDSHIANSNNFLFNKVPVNNFIEEKQQKQDIVGSNKVTGLLKVKKTAIDNIASLRQNILIKQQESQAANKGKSLGNKKVSQIVKDKYGPITQKKTRNLMKSKAQIPKKNYMAEVDEYYEQKWQQQDQQLQIIDKKRQKSGIYSKQHKDFESPIKKEDLSKSKVMTKNGRKENFNIIFNNNTYNLNLVDPNY